MVVEARSYSFHFGKHGVGNRQCLFGKLLCQDIPDAQLVRRIEIGEQETHGDGFDLRDSRNLHRKAPHLRFVERRHHLSIGVDAFVELKAMPALDQRLRLHPAHVVVSLAVAALNEGHVTKAFGRHIGDDGALALQNGVGGDRRADAQIGDRIAIVVAREPGDDAGDRVGRRRQLLPDRDLPRLRIIGDEIRECPADIDTEHVAHASHLGACLKRYLLTDGVARC